MYSGYMSALPQNIESIHPSLWRAAHLSRASGRTVDTGYLALSAQLPGGGWPLGALVELLVQQEGSGEIRLLAPALARLSEKRAIALIGPRQVPHALAYGYLGVTARHLLWLKPQKSADALWSAEQILKAGSCGALLLWQQHMRSEALRRLHLAAQTSETLLIVLRPLACTQDSSPATLRLTVRPCVGGVQVDMIKRKGPSMPAPLMIALEPSPILLSPHRREPRRVLDFPTVGVHSTALAIDE